MAQHFAELGPSIHPIHDIDDTLNKRSKEYINAYNSKLSEQLNVILIEKVDLSTFKTTSEKRQVIEIREGFWQTQLRTLTRYGGLNKKDERKLTCNRLARKASKIPSTAPETGNMIQNNFEPSVNQSASQPPVRRSSRLKGKPAK